VVRGLKPKEPEDLVEVDLFNLTLSAGRVIKQFTAGDVVSGCNVLEVFSSASSSCDRRFVRARGCPGCLKCTEPRHAIDKEKVSCYAFLGCPEGLNREVG